MPIKIAPSLASAPLHILGDVVHQLENAGVDYLHFDIEDGTFVPVMTLGTKIIRDLRPLTSLPFDVHLMMVNPEWLLPDLARWGVNRVTVHIEACPYPRRILRQIVSLQMQAGLAFNPVTPLPDLNYLLPYLSIIDILTTEPEQPDCPFLPEVLQKLHQGKQIPGLDALEWIVDGGLNPQNIQQAVQAGADTIVVGRAVFDQGSIQSNLAALRTGASMKTPCNIT